MKSLKKLLKSALGVLASRDLKIFAEKKSSGCFEELLEAEAVGVNLALKKNNLLIYHSVSRFSKRENLEFRSSN